MQRPESAVEEAQKSFTEASRVYEKALQDALNAFPKGELAEILVVNHDDFTKVSPANMKSTLEEQEMKENSALAKINERSDPSRQLDDNVQIHNSKVVSELQNARRSFANARTNLDNARASQSVATAAAGSTAPQPADTSATTSSTSTSSPSAVETSTTASTGAAEPAVPSSSARAMTPAQKTSREKAQDAKSNYESALGNISGSPNALPNDLQTQLKDNNTAFRKLPHGNNNKSLDEMEAAENRHLGSLNDAQKGSLKQVQESRRNYMNAAVASTQTAARHDAVAGNHPFELADKKKSVFSERSQGIIKNYVDGLRDFNPAKKVLLARREAIASKEAKASQEFLAKMEAKQSTTPEEALGALPGLTQAADAVRSTDPAAAATLDSTVSTVNDAAGAEGLVGGGPRAAAEPGEEKTKDLAAELEKPENKNKEIVYHTKEGQHRISYNNGVFSSKSPEALAKYVAAQGYKDFQINHGDGPTALGLLDNLMKEGVQDVSMTAEMRAKIKAAGGEDQIRIADARSQTFKSTSAVEQSERSLNARTFTRMTSPEEASARATLNREYCTHEDRQDMMELLKEKLDKGEINQEQYAQQAKEVLKPSTHEERASLTAGLEPELKSAIESATHAPAPTAAAAVSTPSAAPSAPAHATTTSTAATAPSAPAPTTTTSTAAAAPAPAPSPPPRPTAAATTTHAAAPAPTTTTSTAAAAPAAATTAPRPTKPLPTTPEPTTAPASPGRPDWTRMGMSEARNALKGAHSHENKSSELASSILAKFNRQGGNPQMLQKYVAGVKNFLSGGENNTKTNFIETIAALAIANPATVPSIRPNLSPPELIEVAQIISKEEKKVENADTALKNFSNDLDDWKEDHPKSSSGEEKDNQENADPNAAKQQDSQEVEKAEKSLHEAKEKIEEKKEAQKPEAKKEEERSTPAPGRE